MKATDVLSKDEIRAFTQASDLQGWRSLATDWGLIAFAMAAVAVWPNVFVGIAALVLIGSRQLGLAVLTHECTHYSLFRTRWLNDVVGFWLTGAPGWVDLHRYRVHHRAHHLQTGTDDDPDLGLTTGFPTPWASLVRKFVRDLVGWTAVRRAFGQLAMDFGFIHYTASTGIRRREGLTAGQRLALGVRHLAPVALTNAALFAVLWAVGHPALYLLWVVAWFTTHQAVLRLRAIAEHVGMERTGDAFANTRTTLVSPLARVFLAPHHVNYHLEHHLLMGAPHWQLPALHRRLVEIGATNGTNTVRGYRAVLQRVVSEVQPPSPANASLM